RSLRTATLSAASDLDRDNGTSSERLGSSSVKRSRSGSVMLPDDLFATVISPCSWREQILADQPVHGLRVSRAGIVCERHHRQLRKIRQQRFKARTKGQRDARVPQLFASSNGVAMQIQPSSSAPSGCGFFGDLQDPVPVARQGGTL